MKIFYFIMPILLLAGCGSSAPWHVSLSSPSYLMETPVSWEVQVKEDQTPVEGLAIQATLEMKNMDHGTLTLPLQERGDGRYAGNVTFPMKGEWEANLTLQQGQEEQEITVPFQVQEEKQPLKK